MIQPITTRTRFKVTRCLYLISNRRASSRSMLIMTSVMIETPQRIKLGKNTLYFQNTRKNVWIHLRYRIQYNVYGKDWLGNEANGIICCCFLNKSFVDGRMDETERRATKIKTFPTEAVMERAMFKVAKNTAMLDDNSSLTRFAIFVEFEPSVK